MSKINITHTVYREIDSETVETNFDCEGTFYRGKLVGFTTDPPTTISAKEESAIAELLAQAYDDDYQESED